MGTHSARVIDLAAYRRRRQAPSAPLASATAAAPVTPMTMVWCPIVVMVPWMPVWG